MNFELQLLEFDLSIANLQDLRDIDTLIATSKFLSFTKSEDELSIVSDSKSDVEYTYINKGWKALKIVGPLDFSLVGVLKEIIDPLSKNGISIFAISTFETDYILIKNEQLDHALKVLSEKFKIHK